MFNVYIFPTYKRHNVLLKSRKNENIVYIYAHMMAFILPVSHCPDYHTTQVVSADLFSHPKVTEMLRKSRENNEGLDGRVGGGRGSGIL